MRTYDFTPLWRSTIGFDRLFDLVETAQRAGEDNYPPYNIERLGEDRYQISLAVAGFSADEIAVTAEQNTVTIEGRKTEKGQREYLYQGISARPFKRQFSLADHVQVKGASFEDGLLRIEHDGAAAGQSREASMRTSASFRPERARTWTE